jgi:hypothetical protein
VQNTIAEAFNNDYDKISDETTYRPLNKGCVFKIKIPSDLTFQYVNIEHTNKEIYNVQVNDLCLIMNQVCNGDLIEALIIKLTPL